MMDLIQIIVLGMYIPIIVMSGTACTLYVFKVLWPSIKGRYFHLQTHAVALSAVMALAAHFSENVYYGIGRLQADWYQWMSGFLPMVGLMKLLILGSSVLAIAVYNTAAFGNPNIKRLLGHVLLLWLTGSALAAFLVV